MEEMSSELKSLHMKKEIDSFIKNTLEERSSFLYNQKW